MPFEEKACWELLTRHYDACLAKSPELSREAMERHLRHTERVAAICREITNALPPDQRNLVDSEMLAAAAILHDVAKFDDKDDHHKIAEDVILQSRGLLGQGVSDSDIEDLGSIIRAHKGKFKPEEDCACAAAILRVADKIDMLRQGADKQKQYTQSLEKIKEYFKKHFSDCPEEAQFLAAFLNVVQGPPKSRRTNPDF